jgi:hypothetical protein
MNVLDWLSFTTHGVLLLMVIGVYLGVLLAFDRGLPIVRESPPLFNLVTALAYCRGRLRRLAGRLASQPLRARHAPIVSNRVIPAEPNPGQRLPRLKGPRSPQPIATPGSGAVWGLKC